MKTEAYWDQMPTEYVWLQKRLLGGSGSIPTSKIVPTIHTPFDTSSLRRLVSLLKSAMKRTFLSSVLLLSGGIMTLHYVALNKYFSGCPVVVATGDLKLGSLQI